MDRIERWQRFYRASLLEGQRSTMARRPGWYRNHGLAEALERIPELRTLSRGTISEYTVVTAAMDPPVLVSMLDASEGGGAEAVGD